MTVYAEPKAKIVCPDCKAEREVSARQKRRIERGLHEQRCWWCSRGTRRCTDRHLRFWLRHYGVNVPKGHDIHVYIHHHGIPAELLELAYLLWPELEKQQRAA